MRSVLVFAVLASLVGCGGQAEQPAENSGTQQQAAVTCRLLADAGGVCADTVTGTAGVWYECDGPEGPDGIGNVSASSLCQLNGDAYEFGYSRATAGYYVKCCGPFN